MYDYKVSLRYYCTDAQGFCSWFTNVSKGQPSNFSCIRIPSIPYYKKLSSHTHTHNRALSLRTFTIFIPSRLWHYIEQEHWILMHETLDLRRDSRSRKWRWLLRMLRFCAIVWLFSLLNIMEGIIHHISCGLSSQCIQRSHVGMWAIYPNLGRLTSQ